MKKVKRTKAEILVYSQGYSSASLAKEVGAGREWIRRVLKCTKEDRPSPFLKIEIAKALGVSEEKVDKLLKPNS